MLTWKGSGLGPAPTREGPKMKYKVIKNTVANGLPVRAGSIVVLDQREANTLMGYGRVVPHNEIEITTNVVEEIQHRDPVPARRGRKPKNGL